MTRRNLRFAEFSKSGVGVPPNRKYQADNLAKLWQEFLSVLELIAKIFGAVSRTISLMRLSALLASKRCRCRNDGFCSDEEQGNTHPKQNPTYTQYVILERMGVDAVIRCFTPYLVPKIRSPASPNPGKM